MRKTPDAACLGNKGKNLHMKTAVIGIGSNSVRMLEAELADNAMTRLKRDRAGTRLFAGLDESNRLRQDSMRKTADAVEAMARTARADGMEHTDLFATSAARDADNSADFAALLSKRTGLYLKILTGEEEARLSFLGATGGRDGYCGVVDIGGGSTELVTGMGGRVQRAVSCQIGAVRLYESIPIKSAADLETVVHAAAETVSQYTACWKGAELPDKWFGTGGTFTALAAVAAGVHWLDRSHTEGMRLDVPLVRGIGIRLAGMSAEERGRMESLQPGRADIVVHGIGILIGVMEALKMPAIQVTEYGNLDGWLLDKAR